MLKRAAEMVGDAGARVGMANLVQCSTRREVAEELATAIARSLSSRLGVVSRIWAIDADHRGEVLIPTIVVIVFD